MRGNIGPQGWGVTALLLLTGQWAPFPPFAPKMVYYNIINNFCMYIYIYIYKTTFHFVEKVILIIEKKKG